ncbi:hypothetical protein OUZ56_016441 [Daphnia magna]|uniref:Uncharacterized protein n=1 Tax=Daphnia magna TaxID=35525 RepID=A0ABR0AQP1_9CRUS|nr:hypothetical protein OUZ56_016441 [Daphnia magna]
MDIELFSVFSDCSRPLEDEEMLNTNCCGSRNRKNELATPRWHIFLHPYFPELIYNKLFLLPSSAGHVRKLGYSVDWNMMVGFQH